MIKHVLSRPRNTLLRASLLCLSLGMVPMSARSGQVSFSFGPAGGGGGAVEVGGAAFDAERGWGWKVAPPLQRIRPTGDPLWDTFAAVPPGGKPAVFSVALPEGRYRLAVLASDTQFPFSIALDADERPWISRFELPQGDRFREEAEIPWRGGELDFALSAPWDPSMPFSVWSGLEIERLDGPLPAFGPGEEPGLAPDAPVDLERDLLPPEAYAGEWTGSVHPYADPIRAFLAARAVSGPVEPTGLDRTGYLEILEGQVRGLMQYQDAEGDIVDPWYDGDHVFGDTGPPGNRRYRHYATPHYAHAAAVLYNSGYDRDPVILESAVKAFERSLWRMLRGRERGTPTAWITGDFYPYALMRAYFNLLPHATPEQAADWKRQLRSIVPGRNYGNPKAKGNWVVVSHTGEFLRAREGFTDFDRVEEMVDFKAGELSEEGTWMFESYAYDGFARYHLTNLLDDGYAGVDADELRRKLWRGAWMSLLMQSPQGQHPTGFRSAQHIWNEAQIAAVFEIYADAYAEAGMPEMAASFKRGARLALAEVGRWILEDGTLHIVKNRFPPEAEHGYEMYSLFTTYNSLAAHMLATAWEKADDAIPEGVAPADAGGYALVREEDFSREQPGGHYFQAVFANAGGSYLQYVLEPGSRYEPLGVHRVGFAESGSLLGPNAALALRWGDRTQTYAVGPGWMEDGELAVLAANPLAPSVEVLEESPERVRFSVEHPLPESLSIADPFSGTSWQVAGVEVEEGGAFSLGGSGAGKVRTATGGDWLADGFSLVLDFRTDRVGDRRTLVSGLVPGTEDVALLLELDERNGVRLLLRDPPGSTGGASSFFPATFSDGWHRIGVTVGDGEATVYLDGQPLGGLAYDSFAPEDIRIVLGKLFEEGAERAFEGSLRGFRLFDGALPPDAFGGDGPEERPSLALEAPAEGGVSGRVAETFDLRPGMIEAEVRVERAGDGFYLIYPFVAFDGSEETQVELDGARAILRHGGHALAFEVLDPAAELEVRQRRLSMPMGEMDLLVAPIDGESVRYRLRPID